MIKYSASYIFALTVPAMSTILCDSLVLGGGLAGASTAFALSQRGARVILCEATSELAQKASGNRFGLIMPYITDRTSPFERAYSTGFAFTRELLSGALASAELFHPVGGIQLPSTRRIERLLEGDSSLLSSGAVRRVSAHEASEIAGIKLSSSAFYSADAGFVCPREVVQAMVEKSINIRTTARALTLQRKNDAWTTQLSTGETVESRFVVLCTAYESSSLTCAELLPLEPVRGQTILLAPSELSKMVRSLLCFDGYLTPASGGLHLAGALYRHADQRPEVLAEDSSEILARLKRWLPSIFPESLAPQSARACFRTSTFDRLPYVGALPDFNSMRKEAQTYQSGTDLLAKIPLIPLPGIFVSLGHGSRGLISCPMSAEIVARLITGEQLGTLAEAAQILSPARLASRILSSAA